MDWEDMLRDLLCKLYEAWGGDCAELGATAGAQIATVAGEYAANGVPIFLPAAKAAFLKTLDDLETLLQDSKNTLTTAQSTQLTGLIADLRKDLT